MDRIFSPGRMFVLPLFSAHPAPVTIRFFQPEQRCGNRLTWRIRIDSSVLGLKNFRKRREG